MMRNTLNYYTGNKYEYYKTANSDFQSKVISDIKKGLSIICHVAPSVLPNYKKINRLLPVLCSSKGIYNTGRGNR